MFDWRDNLDLAEALHAGAAGVPVQLPGSEAALRGAVGRAYYAAFGHARYYAIRHLGFVAAGAASDHGRLIAHFRSRGRPRIARHLHKLRSWRNQCDYDAVVPTLTVVVQDALRDAALVISQL